MLISILIPCFRRQDDLRAIRARLEAAASASPPVDIVIDTYEDRPYFHMAHARNRLIRRVETGVAVISSADIAPTIDYFGMLRRRFHDTGAVWMAPPRYRGVIACQIDELVAAGGFDERFEFYGPEDKELHERLTRRGAPYAEYPDGHLEIIHTPDVLKERHYRLALTKREMSNRGRIILEANRRDRLLVANAGLNWGGPTPVTERPHGEA